MIVTVGVTPYVATDGTITSLIGLADRSRIKVSGNAPPKLTQHGSVEANVVVLTADGVASMGFGSMLDVNVTSDAVYFLIDMTLSEPPVPGAPGGIVQTETYGVGVRVCVKGWGFDSSTVADLGVVSAKASASAAFVSYQVSVVGINASEIASLPGLISGSIGPFDVTKMQTVGAVLSDLNAYFSDHQEDCQPELLLVDIELNDVPLPFELAPSAIYALGRIASGYNYPDAVAKLPVLPPGVPPIDKDFMQAIYDAAVDSLTNPPNASQQQQASDVLSLGVGGGS